MSNPRCTTTPLRSSSISASSFEGLITVEITDGLISHFYVMRNPDKLTAVDIPREISRDV